MDESSNDIDSNVAQALREYKLCHGNAAQSLFDSALSLSPTHNLALHQSALLAQQQGHHARALDLFARAAASDFPNPAPAEYHAAHAAALGRAGKHGDALAAAEKAIALSPDCFDALYTRAVALDKHARLADAIPAYRLALAQRPDCFEPLRGLGIAIGKSKPSAELAHEAVSLLRRAVDLRPASAQACVELGNALRRTGDLPAAVAAFRRGVELQPQSVEARNNLGVSLQETGDLPGAINAFQQTIRLRGDYVEARWNLALALLLSGDWLRGWTAFEWRRRLPVDTLEKQKLPHPEWTGGNIAGQTILLRAEQGLGDTIQFIRYAPLLKQRGATVILECQAKLAPLMRTAPGVDQVVERAADPAQIESSARKTLPPFDLQVRLMSLPGIFGATPQNVPATLPYLTAPPQNIAAWKEKLAGFSGFKVGIAWQGNPTYTADAMRSPPLSSFAPLAQIAGVRLFSLQKGPGTEQIAQNRDRFLVHEFTPPLDDQSPGAFLDTAAVMMNLDLIVTSDTSIAHLAGALGLPVWIALTRVPDWRWQLQGDSTPWYPTMRLFRQSRPGDWAEVFQQIAAELRTRAGLTPQVKWVMAPLSPGDLVDRLTILAIKSKRITDPAKLAHIRTELEALRQAAGANLPPTSELDDLTIELTHVNEALWEVEDAMRDSERDQRFESEFVALSRAVYHANDQRAKLKQRINQLLGAKWVDEKSYAAYRPSEREDNGELGVLATSLKKDTSEEREVPHHAIPSDFLSSARETVA